MKLSRLFSATGIALAALFGSSQAHALAVDLELVLAADVSGSLDAADFALQRDGYAAAFQSAAVQNAILNGTLGRIAVTLVYWSNGQTQSVGWTLIDSVASANAFAAAITAAARPEAGNTRMTEALTFSNGLFAASNGFEGARETIDVSGDGADSTCGTALCAPLQAARDNFANGGAPGIERTINAIWIDDRDFFGDDPGDAIQAIPYGLNNVVTANHSFNGIVQDFSTFGAAIQTKLVGEITGTVPEPGSLALVAAALVGLGASVRRRRS